MNNSAPATQSYILLYQLCTGCPALYKILQSSSHKSSYRELTIRISKSSECFRKQGKHKLKPRKPKRKPHKATNKPQSLQGCKSRSGACQPGFRGCRYLLPAPLKERDAPLPLECHHCTHVPEKPQKQLPQMAFHPQEQTGGTQTLIWSLCGEAGASPGAKEPEPTLLLYPAT